MRYASLFAAVCVVLLMAQVALADVVFFDSEFNDADWDLTVLTDGPLPPGTITAVQVSSGGNPGAYRKVTHDIIAPTGQRRRVVGLHLPLGASYDPLLQGPIVSIDYSQDALGIMSQMRTNPLILQDGHSYLSLDPDTSLTVWTPFSVSRLTEVDFGLLLPDLTVNFSVHPDFSGSGAPLDLGFATSNSTGSDGSGVMSVAGIDNWSISIEQDELSICEEDLFQCREDLTDALTDARDEDGDGEADLTDLCAGTPPLTEVDSDGCTLADFCSGFVTKQECEEADWRNDEPSMKSGEADCTIDKGGPGKADDRCVAAP